MCLWYAVLAVTGPQFHLYSLMTHTSLCHGTSQCSQCEIQDAMSNWGFPAHIHLTHLSVCYRYIPGTSYKKRHLCQYNVSINDHMSKRMYKIPQTLHYPNYFFFPLSLLLSSSSPSRILARFLPIGVLMYQALKASSSSLYTGSYLARAGMNSLL